MSNIVTFKAAALDAFCASRINTYDILNDDTAASFSASKINTYFILQSLPAFTNRSLPLTGVDS